MDQTYRELYANQFLKRTPLELNQRLSQLYRCQVYLKREDQQLTRSFKIRGAFNRIRQIPDEKLKRGVVTCSAGNHAQGVAYSCRFKRVHCTVFVPDTTPVQKQERIVELGRHYESSEASDQRDGVVEYARLEVVGKTFDDSLRKALEFAESNDQIFIHPFNDPDVIIGQGSVSDEIFREGLRPDFLICPIGGGGLVSGQLLYRETHGLRHQIVGVQPEGAPSMARSLQERRLVRLDQIDTFVDGASVQTPGGLTHDYCQRFLDRCLLVGNNGLCDQLIRLYQEDGIITEPAGTLSIAGLEQLREEIRGKTVVCVVSGGNNDILRCGEFLERALIYRGLLHYFVIKFPQRPGALEEFIVTVLSKTGIDIVRFEYLKKSNKSLGSVLIGLQLRIKSDFALLIDRLNGFSYQYEEIKPDNPLYNFLV
jgi:threonine dehydratase